MRITTKGRYALRAVITLAKTNGEKPVSIRELAEIESISPEFLEQIFFKLKKTGMISSTRGPGGGFTLQKKPDEISLNEILEAAGEGTRFTPCTANNGEICDRMDDCLAHTVWKSVHDSIKGYLNSINLQHIIDQNIAAFEGKQLQV
jgi:Rrf2 family iron-sulfur cluster assembly transcriptional regulator